MCSRHKIICPPPQIKIPEGNYISDVNDIFWIKLMRVITFRQVCSPSWKATIWNGYAQRHIRKNLSKPIRTASIFVVQCSLANYTGKFIQVNVLSHCTVCLFLWNVGVKVCKDVARKQLQAGSKMTWFCHFWVACLVFL